MEMVHIVVVWRSRDFAPNSRIPTFKISFYSAGFLNFEYPCYVEVRDFFPGSQLFNISCYSAGFLNFEYPCYSAGFLKNTLEMKPLPRCEAFLRLTFRYIVNKFKIFGTE